jgi:hypothetical protein
MSYVIKNCPEAFKTGFGDSQDQAIFPWGEALRASFNIQLVSVELVISVDQEHGTGIDHIVVCASYTPVAQVGYIIVLVDADLKKNVSHIRFPLDIQYSM